MVLNSVRALPKLVGILAVSGSFIGNLIIAIFPGIF
jgi:hypothetical protein